MKHDLDAINAARRLGDEFVPPLGSRFTVRDGMGHVRCTIVDVGQDAVRFLAGRGVVLYYSLAPESFVGYWFGGTLAYVPEDAPPFEEWMRP